LAHWSGGCRRCLVDIGRQDVDGTTLVGQIITPEASLFSGGSYILFFFTFCFLGALIGDGMRRFAMPSFYFANGMLDLLGKRLFWMVGPQFIGMIAGGYLFGYIFGNLFL